MNTSSADSIRALANRLKEWSDNEEMIDQYYTEHGKDLNEAYELLYRLASLCD